MGSQKRKYDWILFDADNTLFDFHIASKLSFKDLIQSLGLVYSSELYDVYHGVNLEVWHLFEENQIDAQELRRKRFADFYEQINHEADPIESNSFYLNRLVVHSTIYNTTIHMLERLVDDYKLAIITNGLREVQRPRISKLKLDDFFEAIIVSDEIGHSKPDEEYFDYVFKTIDHPDKNRVLVVGDSLKSDIRGGNQYDLDTCWYNSGRAANITDILPTFEIHSHQELFSCL